MKAIKSWMYMLLLLVALPALLSLFPWIHVPRTVQFDDALPYTEINGYKFHTEVYGKPESTAVIVVHGGPGVDFQYLKSLSRCFVALAADAGGHGRPDAIRVLARGVSGVSTRPVIRCMDDGVARHGAVNAPALLVRDWLKRLPEHYRA